VGLALAGSSPALGQAKPTDQAQPADHSKHDHQHQAAAQPTEAGDPFADQVRQLRDKVARLEAALSQGLGVGQSRPMGQGQGMGTRASVGWRVPTGYRIHAQYADCLRCHQTIPSGPLPPSHLEKAGGMDMGMMGGGGPGGSGTPGATPTTSNVSPVDQLRQLRDKVAGIQRMADEGRYCLDILNQIAAVRSALDALGIEILTSHLETCVLGHGTGTEHAHAKPMTKDQLLAEVRTVLARFLK
jgi:DNA-binding FrmR family transcriptional regulator